MCVCIYLYIYRRDTGGPGAAAKARPTARPGNAKRCVQM